MNELEMDEKRDTVLCAVCTAPENVEQTIAEREKAFTELTNAAMPMLDYLNRHYDPHTTAVITEGRVTIVRDEISIPLPIRD